MGVAKDGQALPSAADAPVFGAAADGDADRNMILGAGKFLALVSSARSFRTQLPLLHGLGFLSSIASWLRGLGSSAGWF